MEWNYNIDEAPKGIEVPVKVRKKINNEWTEVDGIEIQVQPIWMATKCGKIHRTYYVPEKLMHSGEVRTGEHFSGFTVGSDNLLAWMPYEVPKHPLETNT
jgi:hypothetical protein